MISKIDKRILFVVVVTVAILVVIFSYNLFTKNNNSIVTEPEQTVSNLIEIKDPEQKFIKSYSQRQYTATRQAITDYVKIKYNDENEVFEVKKVSPPIRDGSQTKIEGRLSNNDVDVIFVTDIPTSNIETSTFSVEGDSYSVLLFGGTD